MVDPTTLFSSLFRSRHAIPSFPLRLSGRFCLIEHAVDEQIVRDEMFICVNFLPLVQYSTVCTIKQLAMVPFVPMGKKLEKRNKNKKASSASECMKCTFAARTRQRCPIVQTTPALAPTLFCFAALHSNVGMSCRSLANSMRC